MTIKFALLSAFLFTTLLASSVAFGAVPSKRLTQTRLKAWVEKAFVKDLDAGFRFPKKAKVTARSPKLPMTLTTLRAQGAAVYRLNAYGKRIFAVVPKISLFSTADFYNAKGKMLNGAFVDDVGGGLAWTK